VFQIVRDLVSGKFSDALLKTIHLLRSGTTRYADIGLPSSEAALTAEHHVSLPGSPHADFRLSGHVHELKEGMTCSIGLPSRTTRLVVAAWGVLTGKGHYRGALSDEGTIGTLRFYNKQGKRLREIYACLAKGARRGDLKLADADPVISGCPPDYWVAQLGLLGRAEVPLSPHARQFWEYANVWVNEVGVPWGARSVEFEVAHGSMSIVHLRAVQRLPVFEWFERWGVRRFCYGRDDSQSRGGPSREQLREELDGCLTMARAALKEKRHEDATAAYSKASRLCLSLAYMPDLEQERVEHLERVANYFSKAAHHARESGELRRAAAYYVRCIRAHEQAGSKISEGLIRRAMHALDELEKDARGGVAVGVDDFMKACYHAGNLCLIAADLVESKRTFYFRKAWDYYVNRIVETVLEQAAPSYSSLHFAEERLCVLRTEHRRLAVGDPSLMDVLAGKLDAVRDAKKEHFPGAAGATPSRSDE
jgi:hypothetical protein